MKSSQKFGMNCILLATLMLVAVFACVFASSCGVACAVNADSAVQFEILFSADKWTLSADGVEIESAVGSFFDPLDNEKAVSVIFKRAMDNQLAETDSTDYTLNFKLPSIGCSTVGASVFDYSERVGSFVLKADYLPAVSEDVIQSLEYRTEDGGFRNYSFAQPMSGGLAFGQNVDAGRYYVRFVVSEQFTFDGRPYSVTRYGEEAFCTVRKATPDAPSLDVVEAEYGIALRNIANYIPSSAGSWRLSATQSNGAFNADTLLHVSGDLYNVKFDYTPNNPNYNTLEGVEVSVRITPRTLRVSVDDAFSLVGEPLKTDLKYEILTPLVGGDREEDLDISFDFSGVDSSVAGEYDIGVKFGNADYKAISISSSNVFSSGRYIVYATSQKVTAPDGAVFEVLLGNGFKDMTLRIELCKNEWWKSLGVSGGNVYRFIFENSLGERVYPQGSFTVRWEDGAFGDATHIGVALNDGEALDPVTLTQNHITVDGNTDVIAFLIAPVPGCNAFGMAIASAVLIAVCCALGVVLIVLTTVYFAGRRYFK